MNAPTPPDATLPDFPALLAHPPADALPAALRAAMLAVADPFAGAPDPVPVLVDTLASLARLGADPEVTAAAILHALPAVQAALKPTIEREHPGIQALLEGQRAAVQVWALHAEQRGTGNTEGLRRDTQDARRDGFTGRLAIHPAQVPVINEVFAPTQAEIVKAKAVVAAFAANPGAGAVGLDGKMYDRPHLARAQRLLAGLGK